MESAKLKSLIQKNLELLFRFFDEKSPRIKIHHNLDKAPDYPRMFFILYTVSRAHRYGFSYWDKDRLVTFFWALYKDAKKDTPDEMFRYVDMYGMRFLNNLGEGYEPLIESFKKGDYASLYTYPVSMYLFMSCFSECSQLKSSYPYSAALFNECEKVFDYLIFSQEREKVPLFSFAEIDLISGINKSTKQAANSFLTERFGGAYLNERPWSSGVAKKLEHFARTGELELFNRGMDFLKSRTLAKYEYVHPQYKNSLDLLYTETDESQYFCIDTQAHLINAYINLYEKNV